MKNKEIEELISVLRKSDKDNSLEALNWVLNNKDIMLELDRMWFQEALVARVDEKSREIQEDIINNMSLDEKLDLMRNDFKNLRATNSRKIREFIIFTDMVKLSLQAAKVMLGTL